MITDSVSIFLATQLRISGLTPGVKLWFIIIPINAAGEGDPCDPVGLRVQ